MRQDPRKLYRRLRRKFLRERRWCEVGLCRELLLAGGGVKPEEVRADWVARATSVHHVRGRGRFLLDTKTWLAVCEPCHRYIHDHPAWARERGYLQGRHVQERERSWGLELEDNDSGEEGEG